MGALLSDLLTRKELKAALVYARRNKKVNELTVSELYQLCPILANKESKISSDGSLFANVCLDILTVRAVRENIPIFD